MDAAACPGTVQACTRVHHRSMMCCIWLNVESFQANMHMLSNMAACTGAPMHQPFCMVCAKETCRTPSKHCICKHSESSCIAVLRGTNLQMHPERAKPMQAIALQRLQSSLKHMRSMFKKSSEALAEALKLAEKGQMWRRHPFILVSKAKLLLAFIRCVSLPACFQAIYSCCKQCTSLIALSWMLCVTRRLEHIMVSEQPGAAE